MAEQDSALSTPPKKYQRYRSVQHAEAGASAAAAPAPLPEKKDAFDASVSRSMSRYRRPKKRDPVLSPPPMPIPLKSGDDGMRRVTDPVSQSPQRQHLPTRHHDTVSQSSQKQQLPTRHDTVAGHRASGRRRETDAERLQRKRKELHDEEERQRRSQKEAEMEELRRAKAELDAAQRAQEEKAELLAEQKRKDLERLEAELEAAAPKKVMSPGREKFSFFSRKRAQTQTTPPITKTTVPIARTTPPTSPESRATSSTFSREKSIKSLPQESLKESVTSQPRGIAQGGSGIVPGTDAPLSASNAGERVSFA